MPLIRHFMRIFNVLKNFMFIGTQKGLGLDAIYKVAHKIFIFETFTLTFYI
jgi:hypothetical protein